MSDAGRTEWPRRRQRRRRLENGAAQLLGTVGGRRLLDVLDRRLLDVLRDGRLLLGRLDGMLLVADVLEGAVLLVRRRLLIGTERMPWTEGMV